MLSTKAVWKAGKLFVNGKEIPLPMLMGGAAPSIPAAPAADEAPAEDAAQ